MPVRCLSVPIVAAAFLLLLEAGCTKESPRSAAQIQTAVAEHLAQRTDLRPGQLLVRAERVRYEGQRAVAQVSIVAADDPKAAMKMVYELEHGEGGWQVVQAAAQPGSVGDSKLPLVLPPGHPPTQGPGSSLPPGHPPVGDRLP